MKSSKLSIYGNVILDRVLGISEFPKEGVASTVAAYRSSPGASANVARAYYNITQQKPKLYSCIGLDLEGKECEQGMSRYANPLFYVSPHLDTSSAVILDCKPNVTRTGLVKWGACAEMTIFSEDGSEWKHFCYLDKLPGLDKKKLSNLKGIKSADLTSFDYDTACKNRIIECLSEIDYLITSKEEAGYLVNNNDPKDIVVSLGKLCKQFAILHDPTGSYVSDGNVFFRVAALHNTLEKISVLGAGDIFAAAFISAYSSDLTVVDILLKSHNKTYEILKEGLNK